MDRSLISFCCCILTAFLAFLPCSVFAADIEVITHGAGGYRSMNIEGPIESGDYDKFLALIKENKGTVGTVNLFSSGGEFYEAMKIGQAMRTLELASQVPQLSQSGEAVCSVGGLGPSPKDAKNCICASACFFIHIGAAHRGGTYLAVHRPYLDPAKFKDLTEAEAQKKFVALQEKAREYMAEMGVPKHIQEDVLGTPSDKILLLDEKTVKTYFWGKAPYLQEWFVAKCGSTTDMSRIEKTVSCMANLEKARRLSAYKKFFGSII